MITAEQVEARFVECGYFAGANRLAVVESAFRGDMIIIYERADERVYVGAYAKDKCRLLTELFPGHVTES